MVCGFFGSPPGSLARRWLFWNHSSREYLYEEKLFKGEDFINVWRREVKEWRGRVKKKIGGYVVAMWSAGGEVCGEERVVLARAHWPLSATSSVMAIEDVCFAYDHLSLSELQYFSDLITGVLVSGLLLVEPLPCLVLSRTCDSQIYQLCSIPAYICHLL